MIREFADSDAEPAAALIAAQSPWLWTAGGIRHALLALPERARRRTWVAAADGEVVGWGEAEFDWLAERDDIGTAWVLVAAACERGVAEHGLTGTRRGSRRRGFARLAKLAALRWCAEAGFVRVTTGNDASNTAMLGLNDELGFRPFAIETEWVKQVA